MKWWRKRRKQEMRILKSLALISIGTLLLSAIYSFNAMAQEGSMEKHEGSMMKEEGKMAAKQMTCNQEHLKMMMQKREDRMCVADGVLADEDTRGILFDKIAADPMMRKMMMKKCEMMEKPQGESGMMKPEGMMNKEGSMMKEKAEGSMMKNEGSMSK
jgi:hypothetical protein